MVICQSSCPTKVSFSCWATRIQLQFFYCEQTTETSAKFFRNAVIVATRVIIHSDPCSSRSCASPTVSISTSGFFCEALTRDCLGVPPLTTHRHHCTSPGCVQTPYFRTPRLLLLGISHLTGHFQLVFRFAFNRFAFFLFLCLLKLLGLLLMLIILHLCLFQYLSVPLVTHIALVLVSVLCGVYSSSPHRLSHCLGSSCDYFCFFFFVGLLSLQFFDSCVDATIHDSFNFLQHHNGFFRVNE